jgi:hypothetical protein
MGFPIQRSPDLSLFSGSPRLIAAYHVFHRLPAPRHPPYALSSLTINSKNHFKFQILDFRFYNLHSEICNLKLNTMPSSLHPYSIVKEQSINIIHWGNESNAKILPADRTPSPLFGGDERI